MRLLISVLLTVVGATTALLLARLVLRLFAARPENPAFAALFALTAPLVAGFAALDAGQPRFGATLEYSTLALCLGLMLIVLLLRVLISRSRTHKGSRS